SNEKEWLEKFRAYRETHPGLADQWADAMSGFLPGEWDQEIPAFKPEDGPIATRAASGKTLNALAKKIPTLIGGSADLAPSNKTYLEFSHEFQKGSYDGRNIRFGVREHAMGGIMSGMFLHNGLRPYGGTFLVFADYLRPSIRIASLMKLPLIYIFTHDSIAVGEDGPTHQPIEHLASLRIIPNLTVIRPADATETADAWRQAIQTSDGPVALILSRQKLPVLGRNKSDEENRLKNGAYIIKDFHGKPDIILMATGSEVHSALEAGKILEGKNISARIVSMPSWELFEKRSQSYQNRILPPDVTARIAIEAGHSMGWERYTGDRGAVIGINRFGASAPGSMNMEKFGFTAENIVQKAMEILKQC
ncbi:MAG: transketolase, partial [Deltaproteobacteria bacterium]|nr:transketolase [Deltaproteobacteria bacterium]